jgi:Holliday junction resolvase RusA-like endonuclease
MSGLLLSVVIAGNPGDGGANQAMRAIPGGKGGVRVIKSKRARDYSSRAQMMIRLATRGRQLPGNTFEVEIRAYWPRQSHLEGCEALALGDVDAPVKSTIDALERAGVFDNDGRVVSVTASKHLDRERPRVELEVRAVSP